MQKTMDMDRVPKKRRSQYRFSVARDVKLLRAIKLHLPFRAGHGGLLRAWQRVVESLEGEVSAHGEYISWDLAQRRWNRLVHAYRNGELDQLRGTGAEQEFIERESLLQELVPLLEDGHHVHSSSGPGGPGGGGPSARLSSRTPSEIDRELAEAAMAAYKGDSQMMDESLHDHGLNNLDFAHESVRLLRERWEFEKRERTQLLEIQMQEAKRQEAKDLAFLEALRELTNQLRSHAANGGL